MLSRPNNNPYLASIEFDLVDTLQHANNSPLVSKAIEQLAPALAQSFAYAIGAMAKKFTILVYRNASMNACALKMQVDVLTAAPFNETAENLAMLHEAIKNSVQFIFSGQSNLKVIDGTIKITNTANSDSSAIYRAKVSQKSYAYDKLDKLNKMELQFVDESKQPISGNPISRRMTYDAWNNITSITYKYAEPKQLNPLHLTALENEVRLYVEKDETYTPILTSIEKKDYNQALRRACAGGNLNLVNLLLRYDNTSSLNIDLNQPSLNGKTPLDYANESKNTELAQTLKTKGAMGSHSLCLNLADTDRERAAAENNTQTPYNLFNNRATHGAAAFSSSSFSSEHSTSMRFNP